MPPSEASARELPPMETPRSVQKLNRFVSDMGQRRSVMTAPQRTASHPIGAAGLSAARFGVQLSRHSRFSGVAHSADWGPARIGRYHVGVADRRAFTPTLVHRKEMPSEPAQTGTPGIGMTPSASPALDAQRAAPTRVWGKPAPTRTRQPEVQAEAQSETIRAFRKVARGELILRVELPAPRREPDAIARSWRGGYEAPLQRKPVGPAAGTFATEFAKPMPFTDPVAAEQSPSLFRKVLSRLSWATERNPGIGVHEVVERRPAMDKPVIARAESMAPAAMRAVSRETTEERKRAYLPDALSHPPIPIASWFGVSTPRPAAASPEPLPEGYARPSMSDTPLAKMEAPQTVMPPSSENRQAWVQAGIRDRMQPPASASMQLQRQTVQAGLETPRGMPSLLSPVQEAMRRPQAGALPGPALPAQEEISGLPPQSDDLSGGPPARVYRSVAPRGELARFPGSRAAEFAETIATQGRRTPSLQRQTVSAGGWRPSGLDSIHRMPSLQRQAVSSPALSPVSLRPSQAQSPSFASSVSMEHASSRLAQPSGRGEEHTRLTTASPALSILRAQAQPEMRMIARRSHPTPEATLQSGGSDRSGATMSATPRAASIPPPSRRERLPIQRAIAAVPEAFYPALTSGSLALPSLARSQSGAPPGERLARPQSGTPLSARVQRRHAPETIAGTETPARTMRRRQDTAPVPLSFPTESRMPIPSVPMPITQQQRALSPLLARMTETPRSAEYGGLVQRQPRTSDLPGGEPSAGVWGASPLQSLPFLQRLASARSVPSVQRFTIPDAGDSARSVPFMERLSIARSLPSVQRVSTERSVPGVQGFPGVTPVFSAPAVFSAPNVSVAGAHSVPMQRGERPALSRMSLTQAPDFAEALIARSERSAAPPRTVQRKPFALQSRSSQPEIRRKTVEAGTWEAPRLTPAFLRQESLATPARTPSLREPSPQTQPSVVQRRRERSASAPAIRAMPSLAASLLARSALTPTATPVFASQMATEQSPAFRSQPFSDIPGALPHRAPESPFAPVGMASPLSLAASSSPARIARETPPRRAPMTIPSFQAKREAPRSIAQMAAFAPRSIARMAAFSPVGMESPRPLGLSSTHSVRETPPRYVPMTVPSFQVRSQAPHSIARMATTSFGTPSAMPEISVASSPGPTMPSLTARMASARAPMLQRQELAPSLQPERSFSESLPAGRSDLSLTLPTQLTRFMPIQRAMQSVTSAGVPSFSASADRMPVMRSAPTQEPTSQASQAPSRLFPVLGNVGIKRASFGNSTRNVTTETGPGGMVIQRVESGTNALPAVQSNGDSGGTPNNLPAVQTPGGGQGGSGNDINMLANEVWALLKRKLTVEAERRGRW